MAASNYPPSYPAIVITEEGAGQDKVIECFEDLPLVFQKQCLSDLDVIFSSPLKARNVSQSDT